MKDDWLVDLLNKWARWYETESGYSSTTTIWRAVMAPISTGFGPSIPKGVEPPNDRAMQKLIIAMGDLLTYPDVARAVAIVRVYYLVGAKETIIRAELKQRQRLSDQLRQGEHAIKGYMRAM